MLAEPTGTTSLPPDVTSFSIDAPYERNRLTSFFRIFTVLPHLIYLMLYSIPVIFAVIGAWFALLFTAKYPVGLYGFVERYIRYSSRVNSYLYLASDAFPPFNGKLEDPYEAVLLVGPPKERYSRAKTFFRGILALPYIVILYGINYIMQTVAFLSWLVILFMGHQPNALQKIMEVSLSYQIRLSVWMTYLTEAWPTVDDPLTEGAAVAPLAAAPIEPTPPAPPVPPAPPAPPTPPAPPQGG